MTHSDLGVYKSGRYFRMNFINKRLSGSRLILSIFAVLLVTSLWISAVSAAEEEDVGAQISVTSVQIEPGVLMRGDTGIVKIQVENTGTESVDISRAKLYGRDIAIVSDQNYGTVTSIGAKNKMDFTFTVRAKGNEGIYYPRFYMDFQNGGSLNYPVPVKVEDSELKVSILEMPDSFSAGKTAHIKLLVGNPRENEVNGVIITPSGDNVEIKQTGHFVGKLEADASSEVEFEVTPLGAGNITFDVEYRNGVNQHSTSLTIPVELSEAKKRAEPLVNNIQVTTEGDGYHISGDVTNAGLVDAKSITVRAGEPAWPSGAYPVYVVGSLEPDGFSTFDITFSAEDADSVPVIIGYKDEDGNPFEYSTPVDLSEIPLKSSDKQKSENKSDGGYPWVTVVALLLLLGGVFAWKKGYFSNLKK